MNPSVLDPAGLRPAGPIAGRPPRVPCGLDVHDSRSADGRSASAAPAAPAVGAISEDAWASALTLLRDTDRTIVLACHLTPDGDALGSMLAAGLGFRQLARHPRSQASFSNPFRLPAGARHLAGLATLLVPAGGRSRRGRTS